MRESWGHLPCAGCRVGSPCLSPDNWTTLLSTSCLVSRGDTTGISTTDIDNGVHGTVQTSAESCTGSIHCTDVDAEAGSPCELGSLGSEARLFPLPTTVYEWVYKVRGKASSRSAWGAGLGAKGAHRPPGARPSLRHRPAPPQALAWETCYSAQQPLPLFLPGTAHPTVLDSHGHVITARMSLPCYCVSWPGQQVGWRQAPSSPRVPTPGQPDPGF